MADTPLMDPHGELDPDQLEAFEKSQAAAESPTAGMTMPVDNIPQSAQEQANQILANTPQNGSSVGGATSQTGTPTQTPQTPQSVAAAALQKAGKFLTGPSAGTTQTAPAFNPGPVPQISGNALATFQQWQQLLHASIK